MSNNQKLRNALKAYGVKQWELGKKVGISEFHFSRSLRNEISDEKLEEYLSVIKELAEYRIAAVIGG